MIRKMCPVCGDRFVPSAPTQKYCDAICYRINDNTNRPERARNKANFDKILESARKEYSPASGGPGNAPVGSRVG